MTNHEILNGKVQLYRRGGSRIWHCSASVGGKQRRTTTKQEGLALAKEIAEDWYLTMIGKSRAGELLSEKTFGQAAERFLGEYSVIVEGERSQRWAEGHEIRLRVHLLPFFGELGLSQVTPGKVQDYRVHRMTARLEPNPHSRSNRPLRDKPPSRSTLHDEIVTLRQVLKTGIRHDWLQYLPDLTPPYRSQSKAEAMQHHAVPDPAAPVSGAVTIATPQLGPVGGRIVAEVFLGLLFADKKSYLNVEPDWTPPGGADFRLRDLVMAALGN